MSLVKALPPYVVELIKIYTNAQSNLINIIASKKSINYKQTLLRQVNKELNSLNNYAVTWSRTYMPKAYYDGLKKAEKGLISLGITQLPDLTSFAMLHKDAIEILARSTANDLLEANAFVGRQIKDNIRQASLEAISEKIATGQSVIEAKKKLTERLVDQGLQGIKTKNGRTINLASYAETIARSTTREATNKALLNQLTNLNYDLVKMSSHNSSCPICAPLEGRIYSISGTSSEFPAIENAYVGGHANIHPNCKHVIMPYIQSLDNNLEQNIETSNRSFETDPRSQRSIDLYKKQQKERQELRQDKNQWQQYRLTLPDAAPKTLSGFRKMKESNNKNWNKLQSDYNSIRRVK